MIVEFVRNPKWENEEQTMVWCEVKFVERQEVLPISVHDHETIPHRKTIWETASAMDVAAYEPSVAVTLDLVTVQETARRSIDRYAGTVREKFITAVSGQALTYQEKADEAADYVAAGYPADLSSYPFIQADVDAMGITSTEAADAILAQKSAWIAIGAQIEKLRLGGKKQVMDATDTTVVATILADTMAALDAVQ